MWRITCVDAHAHVWMSIKTKVDIENLPPSLSTQPTESIQMKPGYLDSHLVPHLCLLSVVITSKPPYPPGIWVLENWTLVLTYEWQVLHPLSQLPGHMSSISNYNFDTTNVISLYNRTNQKIYNWNLVFNILLFNKNLR